MKWRVVKAEVCGAPPETLYELASEAKVNAKQQSPNRAVQRAAARVTRSGR
jgi:hypothetical protein